MLEVEFISDILGFIGIFFLSIRFFPPIVLEMVHIRKNNYNTINLYFVIIEVIAATAMMSAAILVGALPFILANLFSLFFYAVLVVEHYIIKPFCVKKE
tara:strand:- start:330 stop:626 length:297 start_codon:yes stop_codon:yes gene_type:complete